MNEKWERNWGENDAEENRGWNFSSNDVIDNKAVIRFSRNPV
jgi:hypothetical protein